VSSAQGRETGLTPTGQEGRRSRPAHPWGDTLWRDVWPGSAAYREIVQLRPAGAAAARARRAAVPAWHALTRVAVGADPAPAWRWRSPRQRRAAAWGLAAATAAAFAASVAYVTLGVGGNQASQKVILGVAPGTGGLVGSLHLRGSWWMALLILVSLAGVAPLPLAARRPLLGWRIGWLALLGVPWLVPLWLHKSGAIFADWPWDPVQVAVLVVVFAVAGVRQPRGVLWWMWALTLLPWWLQAGQARPGLGVLAVGTIVFTTMAVAADAFGGRHRARAALAGAAERAEAEAARRAVLEERAKIAREMHDVVAHHLSLIAVRAEAAPYRLDRLAGDARTEFGELGGTAREALAEMRRLLGVLRTGQAAEQAPQPCLGDLPGLVEAARDAGLAVEFSRRGPLEPLSAAVGVCAYRVVQESLSNAGRHAPGSAISVTVDVEPPVVRLKVSNGPPAAARNGAAARTPAADGHRHGHGLAGMRERVTLLDGTFAAGPAPGGGFEVTAELPAGGPA
jgi:signal transduction histidine kinase